MPAPAAAPPAAAAAAGTGRADAPDWRWSLVKAAALYFAFQGIAGPNGLIAAWQGKTSFQQGDAAPAAASPASTQPAFGQPPATVVPAAGKLSSKAVAFPLLGPGSALDVYLFLHEGAPPTPDDLATQYSTLVPHGRGAWGTLSGSSDADPLDLSAAAYDELLQDPLRDTAVFAGAKGVLPAARWRNVTIADWSLARDVDLTLQLSDNVRLHNGSIWADIFAVPADAPLRELAARNSPATMRIRRLLTRLFPQRRVREQRKLFGNGDEKPSAAETAAQQRAEEEEEERRGPPPLVTYWHRNFTLAIVGQDPGTGLPIGTIPPPVLQHVHVHDDEEGTPLWVAGKENAQAVSKPVFFPNEFWLLREHMYPINDTVKEVQLTTNLYSTSFFKFQLLAAFSDSFEKQTMGAAEIDLIKETLINTPAWYLALTVAVSLLHSLFEFLAFSSEISHWRGKSNMSGVSVGSILTNVFVQLIILLYLLDQSEETSWMILAGNGFGVVLEAWKLTKAVTVGIVPREAAFRKGMLGWLPYRLDVRDKHVPSEEELRTQEYDRLAFKICGIVMGPVLVAYTIYSALYQEHKGWWSFTIGTLSSFVYAFGFVSLIPQLIVNYKCKSVAGMNPRTFIYKILGTVVDDFFAFAIRMPWLHRLACFRDDLVFCVALYQRWIYGVDDSRINEFGQVVAKTGTSEAEKKEGEQKKETKKTQ